MFSMTFQKLPWYFFTSCGKPNAGCRSLNIYISGADYEVKKHMVEQIFNP